MKELNTIMYRNHKISLKISPNHFTFHATSGPFRSFNKEEFNGGFPTADGAIKSVQEKIDEFLDTDPSTTYEELAEEIHSNLRWTTYQDCEVDPQILEVSVRSFVTANPDLFTDLHS